MITGAAGGIGAAAAEELRRRSARVVGLDLRADGEIVACDVREQASVDAAVAEATERLGGIDVLINNAGVGTRRAPARGPTTARSRCSTSIWSAPGASRPRRCRRFANPEDVW